MSPEERAELERVLAADLDALGSEDDSDEPSREDVSGYVQLDVDKLLQKEVGARSDEEDQRKATWAMLMSSIAFCERAVFHMFQIEMDEVKSIMSLSSPIVEEDTMLERTPMAEANVELAEPEVLEANVELAEPEVLGSAGHSTLLPPLDAKKVEASADSNTIAKTHDELHLEGNLSKVSYSELITAATEGSNDALERADLIDNGQIEDVTPLSPRAASSEPERVDSQLSHTLHVETERISTNPTNATLVREMAFLRTQLARHDLVEWVESRQRELEMKEAHAIEQLNWSKLERNARLAMEREERIARHVVEVARMLQETTAMELEDSLARAVDAFNARELQREAVERRDMGVEEARMWRLCRLWKERQQKEKLIEEKSRLRRSHLRIIDELVVVHATRAEAKRRLQDAERRRAQREMSDMRTEGNWMLRVVVHERMALDAERSRLERLKMTEEDILSAKRREMEYQEHAKHESLLMESEDRRSRVWETLWRLRMKALRKCFGGESRRNTRRTLVEWKRKVDTIKIQENRAREQRSQRDATRRICRYLWQCIVDKRARDRKATITAHAEATIAAQIVQSAFRGFHVRRKFLNALEVAQTMISDRDDEFEEVHLEDLIQTPPELDEDWERPTIKSLPTSSLNLKLDESADHEDFHLERDEREEEVDNEALYATDTRGKTSARSLAGEVQVESGNMASLLWNKMRKKTQKQKQALEERQRQQDPVYRVRKLLARTSLPSVAPRNNNQQESSNCFNTATMLSSVTWSVGGDRKKASQVKLPSLVERLRKKTAAAR